MVSTSAHQGKAGAVRIGSPAISSTAAVTSIAAAVMPTASPDRASIGPTGVKRAATRVLLRKSSHITPTPRAGAN